MEKIYEKQEPKSHIEIFISDGEVYKKITHFVNLPDGTPKTVVIWTTPRNWQQCDEPESEAT